MRRLLLTAGLLFAATPAYASTWFAVSLNGNRCLSMLEFGQEYVSLGMQPTWSPEMFVDSLRMGGVNPTARVIDLGNKGRVATITWSAPQGDSLMRRFFTNISTCQSSVDAAIKNGTAVEPGALR
jgi:hypothetical protein